MGKAHAFQACLVIYIHVIELQLAEFPALISVENILEDLQAVMEAEAKMADFSLCLCLFRKGDDADLLNVLPAFPVQRMEQVNIDMIGRQSLQFFTFSR